MQGHYCCSYRTIDTLIMTQCEHDFSWDSDTQQVNCTKCGDLDDEMQLPNPNLAAAEAMDDFYKTQESFE